ncbi:MAG: tRNA lysidine(34) synthetase TilS [Verrucomicrobiaceae bacterium]|nr:tRNA lysidine(34) synthetase TilS [Verrucomicrobiaceae bacterium]
MHPGGEKCSHPASGGGFRPFTPFRPSPRSLATALRTALASENAPAPSEAALIGVSGGRDSVALLRSLLALGWKKLIVCHLNHSLRGHESDADADFVRNLAKEHGLKCEIAKVRVSALARKQSISTELAARRAREAFFLRMARKHRTPFIFLAHHADDNAETILGNLFRGTGLAGLAGMAPRSETEDGLIKLRPLLALRRSDIDAFVTSAGVEFREDSSNTTPEHRRNRIRHELLPLLDDIFDRDVVPILGRVAQNARRDRDCLDELAREFARTDTLFQADGSLRLTSELVQADPAIQSRILLGLLVDVAGCADIGTHEIESAISMLQPGGPAKINLPAARHLRRKSKRLWVE